MSRETLERLNALIDGELAPRDHAALAARIAGSRDLAQAHATLARLKAAVVDSAELTPPIVLPRRRRWRGARVGLAAGAGLGVAAAAAVALFIGSGLRESPQSPAAAMAELAPLVTLAALPGSPVLPDLTEAGLKLVQTGVERVEGRAVFVAAYRGPRGCRLELRVRPSDVMHSPASGTSHRAWTAGPLAYELVAFGMPDGRFAAISAAAESATRAGQLAPATDRRLREASLAASPCVG